MPRKRRPKHPRFDPDLDLSRVPLAGQLDLHGLTVAEAEAAVLKSTLSGYVEE